MFVKTGTNGPYTIGFTRTDRGIGSGNAALGLPYIPPIASLYGVRHNVKKSFDALPRSSFLQTNQALPKIDLRGNAATFSGSFNLTALKAGNI